jgi:hypothetical protein
VNQTPPATKPSNPFKEGTKKFLVAQRLIAGDTDKKRIVKDIGVNLHTLYSVASDLRAHGYSIARTSTEPKNGAGDGDDGDGDPSRTPQERPQGRAQEAQGPSQQGVWMTRDQIDEIVEEAMLRTAEALNPEGAED